MRSRVWRLGTIAFGPMVRWLVIVGSLKGQKSSDLMARTKKKTSPVTLFSGTAAKDQKTYHSPP